jgi:hypothetical protein
MIPSASLPPGRTAVFDGEISITSTLGKMDGPRDRHRRHGNSFFMEESGFGLLLESFLAKTLF